MTDTLASPREASLDRELEFKKLQVDADLRTKAMRADVQKVVFGTMIVGIAVAFFPFAQEYAKSWFARSIEEIRTQGEINRLQEQNKLASDLERLKFTLEKAKQDTTDIGARRAYLEQLAIEARSENIERQIIISEFFSFLGEPEMRPQWEDFREYLIQKQERLNAERAPLLATVNSAGVTAADRASAVERLQQIDRLQNPQGADVAPNYNLPIPPRASGESRPGRRMLEIAIREVNSGIHEVAQSERVADYWHAVGEVVSGDGGSLAWSAAFMSWIIHESGNPSGLALSGLTISIWRSAAAKKLSKPAVEARPVPGDIAFRAQRPADVPIWLGSKGVSSGTSGIVYAVGEGVITVIAGNENNAVRPVTWRLDDPRLVGFVHLPDVAVAGSARPASAQTEEPEGE